MRLSDALKAAALAGTLFTALAAAAEPIPWSEDRPLTWSDFEGEIDPEASADTAAMTAASLNWSFSYSIERGRRCRFRITEIGTQALFHPDESWVRSEHRTDIILEHEQGHFDLTQVFRLMLDSEADALVGEARSCGRGDATTRDVEPQVERLVQPVREEIWQRLQQVQAEYDAATRHGILEDVQRQWTARIRDAVGRGSWD